MASAALKQGDFKLTVTESSGPTLVRYIHITERQKGSGALPGAGDLRAALSYGRTMVPSWRR